jgi:hypothetical protein
MDIENAVGFTLTPDPPLNADMPVQQWFAALLKNYFETSGVTVGPIKCTSLGWTFLRCPTSRGHLQIAIASSVQGNPQNWQIRFRLNRPFLARFFWTRAVTLESGEWKDLRDRMSRFLSRNKASNVHWMSEKDAELEIRRTGLTETNT